MTSRPVKIPLIPTEDVVDDAENDFIMEPASPSWGSFFPASFPRANSFGNFLSRTREDEDRNVSFMAALNTTGDPKKWLCESPMTHHIIRSRQPRPASIEGGGPIRKRRSQSFGDYIEQREEHRHRSSPLELGLLPPSQLHLPPLNDLVPPQRPTHLSLQYVSSPAAFPASDRTASEESVEVLLSSRDSLTKTQGDPTDEPLSPHKTSSIREDNETPEPSTSSSNILIINIMYGIINATIVIPVVMSFGNIIYQDSFFGPFAPVLIKLTMVSGVVHQFCFSALSSLPFAIGSVQDAGLIFLSSMATSMVQHCQMNNLHDDEVILATVTVGLGLASLVLGFGLIFLGRLRLAGYVQMLPTCVVAGYLAYIGFFCGKSGLALMAIMNDHDTSSEDTTLSWNLLLRQWIFVLPGFVGGIFIYLSVRSFRHVAVLPCCILVLLCCFYAGLLFTGTSIAEATEHGWIRQAEQAPVWYHTWDYLKLNKVVWSALPQLALTEISMIFVVALSSSLDVAAIELELGKPLDYNQELTMVGISNVISGGTGGYTGSYIFSQSIFSLRAGIQSRVAGFSLAVVQLLVIVTPFPLLSVVPNFFYGSLLGMICLDLMIEWLWDFQYKVTIAEYAIGLATFGLIQWLGVEYGILAGVLVYVVCRQLGVPVGSESSTAPSDDEPEGQDMALEKYHERTPLKGGPSEPAYYAMMN